jgi:hypothetical protein
VAYACCCRQTACRKTHCGHGQQDRRFIVGYARFDGSAIPKPIVTDAPAATATAAADASTQNTVAIAISVAVPFSTRTVAPDLPIGERALGHGSTRLRAEYALANEPVFWLVKLYNVSCQNACQTGLGGGRPHTIFVNCVPGCTNARFCCTNGASAYQNIAARNRY